MSEIARVYSWNDYENFVQKTNKFEVEKVWKKMETEFFIDSLNIS